MLLELHYIEMTPQGNMYLHSELVHSEDEAQNELKRVFATILHDSTLVRHITVEHGANFDKLPHEYLPKEFVEIGWGHDYFMRHPEAV